MAQERTVKLQVDATDAIKDLKKVRGEIDGTYAELRRTTPIDIDGTKAKQVIKDVDTNIKGAVKSTENIGGAAEKSVFGFEKLKFSTKAFGVALKATGIGLLVSIFVKLGQALSKNQIFMDNFNVVTEKINITFQKLVNTLVDATVKVGKFFSKVGSVIKKFVTSDLDGIKNGYEDLANSSDNVEKRTKSLARQIIDLRNAVKLAEAEQRKLQLTYQKDAEIQRQIRDNTSLTIDERIAANEKLGNILNAQFEDERSIALQRIELAEKELSKNKDNIDLQVALINAKTELVDLDERITGQRSEQLVNLTSLENEYKESIKETGIQLKASQDTKKQGLELQKSNSEAEINLLIETEDKKRELLAAGIEANKQMRVGAAMDIFNSLHSMRETELNEEKANLDKQLEAGLITQEKYDKKLKKIEKNAEKRQKKQALVQILVSTAQGISKAIAAGAGIPFPANLGAILAGVSAVVGGMASAKDALSSAGGGSGGGGDDTPSPTIPTPQGLGALTPNLEGIEQPTLGGTQPAQAYVIESDISNAQALQEELNVQATL